MSVLTGSLAEAAVHAVREAGGRVTAPDGAPLPLSCGGPLLASNGILHPGLQRILT